MKNYILLLIASLGIISCNSKEKDFEHQLDKTVTDAEITTSAHDSAVQYFLENNKVDSIAPLTVKTLAILNQKLTDVNVMKSTEDKEPFKSAGEVYIQSMLNFVRTLELYSTYTDSISEQEIEAIDNKNIFAAEETKLQHYRYNEYRVVFVRE